MAAEKEKERGKEKEKEKQEAKLDIGRLNGTQWTPSHAPSTPTTQHQAYIGHGRNMSRAGHRRALSDSTIPDTSVARESDAGGFKIIITQPGEDQRPRTLEDIDPNHMPLLEVAIPTWKIGTPRFSLRGTPFIRGSSYAPTEDFRSSSHSLLNRSFRDMTPQIGSIASRRPSPVDMPQLQVPLNSSIPPPLQSGRLPAPNMLRSTYMSTHLVIEPAMFDSLTFKPGCDDRAIVRYSSTTGAVTAATPPRLVAEITSPSFLDYELLSDFFLTFRAFLDPTELLRMLIARLRWALGRDDEVGMVVRVRTFVALRHWILNYFMDDFVIDYNLRLTFCDLLNDFCDELSQDLRARKVQLKILAELKKCWRRVCAQYWDGPEFDASLPPDAPIAPGGIAGHRNPSLDPSFWESLLDGTHQLDGVLPSPQTQDNMDTGVYHDMGRSGNIDSVMMGYDRPGTPENPVRPTDELERGQTSPTSVMSLEVISCSFPSKNMKLGQPNSGYPLAAHPVPIDPSTVYNPAEQVATTPRALMGKRVRPQNTHKRNVSLTDSLREHASAQEKLIQKNTEILLSLPYAGSLVRGNLLPPGQAFVEVLPPSTSGGPSRHTTVFQPYEEEPEKDKVFASAMSSQGMKRLLGSVRRALSTRGQGISPTQGNFINISPIGPRGATTNRLPGTAIVPQARPRLDGFRPPVRIDLLGAEIAEDFKKAVREDAAADADKLSFLPSQSGASSHSTLRLPRQTMEFSPVEAKQTFEDKLRQDENRPLSDTAITTGSKSIVIVDDTVPMPMQLPIMAGALPAVNSSVEAFAETFMPQPQDPTPPNTPPGQAADTPRRSSYILGQHVIRSSYSADPLPPFVPDMDTLGQGPSTRPSEDMPRPSVEFVQQSPNRPPLSGRPGHSRHRSSRSFRSRGSMARRRYTSFHSGTIPRSTVRSFDATTYSEGSVDGMSDVPIPQPLRVLRRRPGGDLRAVNNVGDLDHAPLRRSRSVGSLTTFTESIRSSYMRSPMTAGQESSGFVDVVSSDYSRDRAEATFSLGAIAEKPKRQLSLFSTHSSKPIMRPSFEAEAQKLAQIPDDVDDDGGVESALLKLEGKYEKRPPTLSMEPTKAPLKLPTTSFQAPVPETEEIAHVKEEKKKHRHEHVGEEGALPQPPAPSTDGTPVDARGSFLEIPPPARAQRTSEALQSFLSGSSNGSYSSIPLLERGLTDDGRRSKAEWTNRSILQGPDEDLATPSDRSSEKDSQHPSYDFVKKTESMEKIKPGETMPATRPTAEQLSFLNDESDDDGELSSEISEDMIEEEFYDEDDVQTFPPVRSNTVISRLPPHPLAETQPEPYLSEHESLPPSPEMTMGQALAMSPETAAIPQLHDHQVWEEKPLPPTPDTTPTEAQYGHSMESARDPTGTTEALRNAPKLPDQPSRKFSVHLPFILAFDSEVLAQQFTLIEKDALNEIDWKELIDMRWKNAENGDSRSWVDFLRNTDARGVEVVVARFNIMVKWAASEVVLTQDLEERARCIIKYIHIAAHCRRYRNFATMSQIAIALTSNEISRLSRTWSMVPPSDIRALRDMEALVSPTRNFYNLRAEMEGGGTASADMGCIPFVGIYTHDLIFNAQRPSEIASSPTTAPLVNFERCRIAASVVKTLLRLLEASTLYTFQPIEGITERCLWMSALGDEEIRRHSESLE